VPELTPQLNNSSIRRTAVGCRVISPPYTTIVPLGYYFGNGHELPLGSVVYGTDTSVLSRLGHLAVALLRDPWIIPCLPLPPGEDEHGWLRELVPMLGIRLAVVQVAKESSQVPTSHVLGAVRDRPIPDEGDLATYVCNRLGTPELMAALTHQFREALGGDPASKAHSVATYSRQFRRYGTFTARDWRALGKLTRRFCDPAFQSETTNSRDSQLCLASGRTLHRHIRKYLGMSWARARSYLGWEWIVERGLREGRYQFDDPDKGRSA